jgi:flagellar biosynthesis protein FlhG
VIQSDRRAFGRIVDASPEPMSARDQADGIRRLMKRPAGSARVVAVTSGKGGVGKTSVSVNLSLLLAEKFKKVVLVDLDLGLPNADILLDMEPRSTLGDVISGRRSMDEVMIPVANHLRVIPGASGMANLADLGDRDRRRLANGLNELCNGADFVIFDTGAGISKNTTSFLAMADEVLVVTTPEPTAVVDAFAVIKLLSQAPDPARIGVVLNMAHSAREAERVVNGIVITAKKLLHVPVGKRGVILQDPHVGEAVRRRRPVVLRHPSCPASRALRDLADGLMAGDTAPVRRGFVRRLMSMAGR